MLLLGSAAAHNQAISSLGPCNANPNPLTVGEITSGWLMACDYRLPTPREYAGLQSLPGGLIAALRPAKTSRLDDANRGMGSPCTPSPFSPTSKVRTAQLARLAIRQQTNLHVLIRQSCSAVRNQMLAFRRPRYYPDCLSNQSSRAPTFAGSICSQHGSSDLKRNSAPVLQPHRRSILIHEDS